MADFYTSSPTVTLPPQGPHQYFNSHYSPFNGTIGSIPNAIVNATTPNGLNSVQPTPGSLAGRKRSRGNINAPDDDDQDVDGSVTTRFIQKPRGKPVYRPGMTVIYPDDLSYRVAAESQSGTWVEGVAELRTAHMKRPSASSRKSQRINRPASDPDDLAQLVLPAQMREATVEPLIDEATRVLGISWTRMDSKECLQINAAAYSKWIQNYYPSLKNVQIWFENSAIPGYLVQATNTYNGQQGYYIFSNDLTEARVVTTEPAQLVPRLLMLPALHLAAPGGHIRAETDPITTAQNEVVNEQAKFAENEPQEPIGACTAHQMEVD